MTITTDHAASSYGMPVILGDDGQPLDFAPGIQSVRKRLGLTTAELAARLIHPRTGAAISSRTVENWEQGRNLPDAAILHQLGRLLGAGERG